MKIIHSIFLFLVFLVSSTILAQLTVKDQEVTPNVLLKINDEGSAGSITLEDAGNVSPSSYKLYRNGSKLYWDGNPLSISSSFWSNSGANIYYNSGNVGIGTANPLYKLHANSIINSGVAIYGETSGTYGVGVYGLATETTGYGVYGRANETDGHGVYGLSTGTSGKGIYGWSSNLENEISYGGYFLANGTNSHGVYGKATGTFGYGVFGYSTGTTGRGIVGEALSTGYAGYFSGRGYFSDNLGIGTEDPSGPLHIKMKGTTIADGIRLATSLSTNEDWYFYMDYKDDLVIANDVSPFLTIQKNTGNIGIGVSNPSEKFVVKMGGYLMSNPHFALEEYGSNNKWDFTIMSGGILSIGYNETSLINITSDGAVGIGTSSPQGKLDVYGAIYQRGFTLLHADYVFDDDYDLESIEEHAEFMWKNKHLKAIPKATVDENGIEYIEVGAHRKGIVEELEKAHIYISQLENSIKELTKRIENLEK